MPVKPPRTPDTATTSEWTFLTNHSHVLVFLDRHPEATQREMARAVGITERAVQHILGDLETAGVISRQRIGRRNRYDVHPDRALRHPLESHRTVRDLLSTVR